MTKTLNAPTPATTTMRELKLQYVRIEHTLAAAIERRQAVREKGDSSEWRLAAELEHTINSAHAALAACTDAQKRLVAEVNLAVARITNTRRDPLARTVYDRNMALQTLTAQALRNPPRDTPAQDHYWAERARLEQERDTAAASLADVDKEIGAITARRA
jgi:hypothetical protein